MGFNGVRKHQKIEDPRYLYWADRLGLLVWEEMPSAYRFTRSADHAHGARMDRSDRARLQPSLRRRLGAVQRVVGRARAADDAGSSATRSKALYHLTKTLDATRPVIGNDGWESSATDIIGIHDYDANPEHMRQRYGTEVDRAELFDRRGPGGRILTLDGYPHRGQPIMLTEFGGIAFAKAALAVGPADEPEQGRVGLFDRRNRRRVLARVTGSWSSPSSMHRCSAASATRSSPTRSRKSTACSTPTARRRFRWKRSRKPPGIRALIFRAPPDRRPARW